MLRTIIFMMALLAAPASANFICANPSLWTPNLVVYGDTCQNHVQAHSQSGGALNGIDFSVKVQCSSISAAAIGRIDSLARICCGTVGSKASPCRNRGYVCADPRFYQPDKSILDDDGVATTCDQLVAQKMTREAQVTRKAGTRTEAGTRRVFKFQDGPKARESEQSARGQCRWSWSARSPTFGERGCSPRR